MKHNDLFLKNKYFRLKEQDSENIFSNLNDNAVNLHFRIGKFM